jgi:serine/threonine protein kinase
MDSHVDCLQLAKKVHRRVCESHHLHSRCLGAAGELYLGKLQAVSTLKVAKSVRQKAAIQLKRELLLEHDPSIAEDEQEKMQVQQAIKEKRKALKDGSAALQKALQQVIILQQNFPEIVKEIRAGLPQELVELWRPDLSLDVFESCVVLFTDSRHMVYKAFMDGKAYALKQFVVTQDMDLKQLIREAALLRRMQHPAIVQVLSIFEHITHTSSSMLLQMPFFEHGTLDQWITNHLPEWKSVRVVLFDVAGALEHLHSFSVIHCDVKPSNILVAAPHCRGCLADFDISMSSMTRTCTVAATRLLRTSIGFTPGFESPELARYLTPNYH